MLSKCANPNCSRVLRYLHQGKIFVLSPSPAMQIALPAHPGSLEERFWLCDQCSAKMRLVWGGAGVKLVPLHAEGTRVTSPFSKDGPARSSTKDELGLIGS